MTLLNGSDPQTLRPPAPDHAGSATPGVETGPQPQFSVLPPGAPAHVIRGNEVGRDLNVGENVNVTNYLTRLAHLHPHPVTRNRILARATFEPPT